MGSGSNHWCLFMDSPIALDKDEIILENFYPGYISALDAYSYDFPIVHKNYIYYSAIKGTKDRYLPSVSLYFYHILQAICKC